ncbi:hypothetical protein HK097_009870 [Rhizophlyctis rosea]|uniref:Uncharacterized protein n=1 Tax=Rhizophlyctis rosea TaxID=64517 RepID=A0AAD5SAP7_9FUNG|nr:hypothetical protein HK097_009870 [Rhizophlyctis rosea]
MARCEPKFRLDALLTCRHTCVIRILSACDRTIICEKTNKEGKREVIKFAGETWERVEKLAAIRKELGQDYLYQGPRAMKQADGTLRDGHYTHPGVAGNSALDKKEQVRVSNRILRFIEATYRLEKLNLPTCKEYMNMPINREGASFNHSGPVHLNNYNGRGTRDQYRQRKADKILPDKPVHGYEDEGQATMSEKEFANKLQIAEMEKSEMSEEERQGLLEERVQE